MKTTFTVAAILSLSLATLATTACGKKDEPAAGGAAAAKPGEPAKPAPVATEWMKVGALGLEAQVPAGTTIDDKTAGAGFPTATIWGSPTMFVTGGGEMSPLKPELEASKAELKKDPNPFKSFTKEEKTEGGWHLEFELESMIDKAPIYGVQIRTTIDGKPFDCGTNAQSAAERDAAAAVCKSLRKAT